MWSVYEGLEGPLGSAGAYFRSGIVAHVLANLHAKKGKSFTPADFMPREKAHKREAPQDMLKKLMGLAMVHGEMNKG